MLINNNLRFYSLCIRKVSSTSIFRRIRITLKTKNYIDTELKSESDSDSVIDIGTDIDIDNEKKSDSSNNNKQYFLTQ